MYKMLRPLICLSLCMMTWTMPVFASDISITIDDQPLVSSSAPIIENDRVLVPMRSIMESLGYEIVWDGATRSVTGTKDGTEIFLSVDYSVAIVNGEYVSLDAYPKIIDGTTYVPLRFLSDHSGAELIWSSANRSVSIYTDAIEISASIAETSAESVVYIQTNSKQGSGVILSEDGLIATNFHIIDGAKSIQFMFSDRTVYQDTTTVVSMYPEFDLAILKIDATDLDAAIISEESEVGDDIFTVSSPLGEHNVITDGVILSQDANVINISAPINNGSSGGGLFDEDGNLIGIIAFFTDTEYFAIPVERLSELEEVNLDFSLMRDYVYTPSAPSSIIWTIENGYAYISWEPVYDAEYYKIYIKEDGEFTPLENDALGNDKWYWCSPYCFGISTSNGSSVSLALTTVYEGVESDLSDTYKIIF